MTNPKRKEKQAANARRVLVSECYKRGLTIRQTAEEIMQVQGLSKPPSTRTIFMDRESIMKEWREERVDNVDDLKQLELQRIDDAIARCWVAYDRSTVNHKSTTSKRKGAVPSSSAQSTTGIKFNYIEQVQKEELMIGDVRYIAEIRAQLMERRKILGLYAPDKKELSGIDGKAIDINSTTNIDYSKLSEAALNEILNATT